MTERLRAAQATVLADYRGLNVTELNALRRELRKCGSEIHIIKNSLLRRAFGEAGLSPPDELLVGPTAVALLFDDLSTPAKVLLRVAKDTERLQVKGGVMGGRALDARAISTLSDLPSRAELLGRLLGVINAPARQLVTVLQAPLRDVAGLLRAHAESEGEAEAAA